MTDIPLARGDYRRKVAKEPYIPLLNRFAESNPTLNNSPVSVISRPAQVKFTEAGSGHIRATFNQPGTFGGDLFVVSGLNLYRVGSGTGAVSLLGVLGTDPNGAVSMCATGTIGTTPAYLYIAEGGVLWLYTDNGKALGHLQATGTVANNDTVRIGNTYYKWTNADVNAGTPDGTSGNPWLVNLGAGNGPALSNLFAAIGATGEAGVTYSTALTAHTLVEPLSVSTNDLFIGALDAGAGGNGIVTTETGAGISWGAGTLGGGGGEQLRQVAVPDDLGAISVATINRYVIVVPVQEEGYEGRFFWIQPGETVIDPLDFATAERSADMLHQVVVFGDMYWLLGQKTTEPWITTGDPDFPMARFQGILFDRGSWPGTAVQVKDSLIVVDEEGGVFQISGGQRRISRPDIEERIRRAMMRQSLLG